MIGRIVRPADFERVLATPPRSRSAHFAVHHVSGVPSLARKPAAAMPQTGVVPQISPELSTAPAPSRVMAVDDLPPASPDGAFVVPEQASGHWLGLVVPKRHAKRAVTRNLIKRQARAAMAAHAGGLPPGLWVLRLKMPFDRTAFRSPASVPLRACAADELQQLFRRAASAAPVRRP